MEDRKQVEGALREWLRGHHGVIGRSEALQLGATDGIIRSKLDRGEWERVHFGVYRDAAAPSTHYQELRAAYVATAGHASASHASAAWLWGLLAHPPARPELTVLAPAQHGRRLDGLRVHRSGDLDWSPTVTRHTIAVTDPLRTLVDLGSSVSRRDLADAVDKAVASGLVGVNGLLAELSRLGRSGRSGPASLRRLLADRGFVGVPRPSVLETKMAGLVIGMHLPPPELEVRAGENGEYRLDYAYRPIKLAVEVDGYVWHWSPEHLQRDHFRRNQLQRNGWVVLVYTWRDVVNESSRVGREIADTYRRLAAPTEAAALIPAPASPR
jgi:hypothetical protein